MTASCAEVVPYDLQALTTGGRFWVRGTARHGCTESPYAFFVKLVQSWARSPLFDLVPADLRAHALAMVPWHREPDVYRSDLDNRLPDGLRLPRSFGVFDIDEMSASVWLGVVDAEPVRWDVQRHAAAAYLLGRLAAREDIAPIAELGAVPQPARTYASGRVQHVIAPALLGDEIWSHPLVAQTFDDALRDRLRDATGRLPAMLDELDAMPVGTLHGDACTRNLLVESSRDGFVLIDFGFWGRGPLGFDLTQLVLGEVQMGERPAAELPELGAACLAAYVEGLRAEGTEVPVATVARAHALLALLFSGLSAIPFEDLGGPVTDELVRVAGERAAAATFMLDLVDATQP
ncbi:MAG TPA: phosphotransferase [Actinomycetes bacterium]|nr:phosphotransferase [Actinomycetes bacterium]